MKLWILSLLVLSTVYLGITLMGCSTAGKEFDTSNISEIEKGVTTKRDILNMFGKPLRMEVGPAGESWTYSYVKSNVTGAGVIGHYVGIDQSETSRDTLTLMFDGDVVSDYRYTQSQHVDTYTR